MADLKCKISSRKEHMDNLIRKSKEENQSPKLETETLTKVPQHNQQEEKPFDQVWGFNTQVRNKLPGCIHFETFDTGQKFKSGRKKFITKFFTFNNELMSEHYTMELDSRKTYKPYFMTMYEPIR